MIGDMDEHRAAAHVMWRTKTKTYFMWEFIIYV